jgi:hypothetical protein
VNIWRRDPRPVDLVLEAGQPAVNVRHQVQRRAKREQGNDQCENTNVAVAPGDDQQQQPANRRRERYQRQNHRIERAGIHRTPIQIM